MMSSTACQCLRKRFNPVSKEALGVPLLVCVVIQAVIGLCSMLLGATAYAQEWLYTVRPGDNIWNLTEEYLSDMRYWRRLQSLNQVTDPEHLPPGSRLRIPIAWLRVQPTVARIQEVRGEANVTLAATGQTIAASPDLPLHAGDKISTGQDGSATLQFGDGSSLLLQPDGELVMDMLTAFGESGMVDTRMRLQRGRVDSRAAPRQGPSTRYEIWTPAAVTAVRGTRYRVSTEADRPLSRAEVISGQVGVSGGGKTRLVPASFGTVAKVGVPPLPPVRLLSAPDVTGLPRLIERVPIGLEIPVLPGAVRYRVQISASDDFYTLLFDGISDSTRFRGPDLPDGEYTMRLRGIDSQGLEGLDGYHRFTLNARPEPPTLAEPKPETIVYDTAPTFQWSEPQQASSFHFQLADNTDFNAPLVDTADLSKATLTPDLDLQSGSYFWRVATRDTTGETGPFSDPQSFKLQPAPTVEPPKVDGNDMVLRWSGLPGQHYQFQLAKDSRFEQIVVDTATSEPQVRIPRPESGFYYLRIATTDPDGYRGPYGPPQRITVPPESYWPLGIFAILVMVLAL